MTFLPREIVPEVLLKMYNGQHFTLCSGLVSNGFTTTNRAASQISSLQVIKVIMFFDAK